MATYRIHGSAAPAPGTIASAREGDTVVVYRSATSRHDWAALAQAAMTAFARGARLRTVRNTEVTQ